MKNKGNTLIMVVAVLIIISILSLAIIYAVSYSSSTKLQKSNENFRTVIFENEAYKIMEAYIESETTPQIEDVKNKLTFKDELDIKQDSKSGNYCYYLRFKDETACFLFEFSFDTNTKETKIIRWGMTTWTS